MFFRFFSFDHELVVLSIKQKQKTIRETMKQMLSFFPMLIIYYMEYSNAFLCKSKQSEVSRGYYYCQNQQYEDIKCFVDNNLKIWIYKLPNSSKPDKQQFLHSCKPDAKLVMNFLGQTFLLVFKNQKNSRQKWITFFFHFY